MAIRAVPFGATEGFSDQPIPGQHFHSQNMVPTLFGTAPGYSLLTKESSASVTGLGRIRHQASLNGFLYIQDDAGKIWKESTRGAYDFTNVRSPDGNGAGLLADQYGNLFYACGSTNQQLGKFDGTTWTDDFQSLSVATQHPMDWYESTIYVADGSNVAALFSDGSWNDAAFTIPSQMDIIALRSGPAGLLLGATMGNRSAIILWDTINPRARVPWKWVAGKVLAIEPYGEMWLVKTDRQVWITNGTTLKEFFGIFDDPLAMNPYANDDVLPQQMALVNDVLMFTITTPSTPDTTMFGKKKPGLYLYFLTRKAWAYIPVSTGSTYGIFVDSLFSDLSNNRILVGFSDSGTNYIAQLVEQSPATAQIVSEEVGLGRIKYQRVFFGPTDKTLEAIVLNMSLLNSVTNVPTMTFTVAVKAYNFKRQLWGSAVASATPSSHNEIIIDATSTTNYSAKVGDEVTILNGSNAGFIAHITGIANQGATNETWTLDLTPANATTVGTSLQVQPFTLIKRQTFTTLDELKNLFFSVNSIKGKQFLIKVVFRDLGTNLIPELQTSYVVWNDIGYNQT